MTFCAQRMMNHTGRCGDCEAFEPMGAGNNCTNRKFRDRAGYCRWTPAGSKMMTTYENNVPCSKFVPKKEIMVAVGK